MIRKILLSTVAIAAISGTAFAADLPSRRAPPVYIPPPIPLFSWTGFYVGGQVGYEFGKDRVNTNFAPLAGYDVNPSGVIGGAHVGYNYALGNGFGAGLLGGGLVVGLELDVNGADDRNSTGAFFAPYGQTHRKDVEGSARGRLGIAVDRALFYVTGGAAFAQFHDDYLVGVGAITVQDPRNTTRIGYTVGAGMEYAVTPNWSLRAEYRYTDFGTYGNAGVLGTPLFVANKVTDNRVQVGFSYKFESPVAAPVVARY